MAASRNEATGDVLANVKGRADAYADGWDRIFGNVKGRADAYADGWDRIFGKKEEAETEEAKVDAPEEDARAD